MFSKNKISIEKALYKNAKQYAEKQGYSSVSEFVEHLIEKEIDKNNTSGDHEKIKNQLKGLGYIS